MKNFEYMEALNVTQTISLLTKYGEKAKLIAGGTDLLGIMKEQIEGPEVLINIMTIPNMDYIKEDPAGLRIGVLTSLNQIESHQLIREKYSPLAQAVGEVGSPQLRNMGTIGGNLCQRPRCWYFRARFFNCYKKGGEICFATSGENKYHCILGGELCYMVHPSDSAPALIALEAKAKIANSKEEKIVPLENFFIGPGKDVSRENILATEEILTEIQIPKPEPNTKGVYLKDRERKSWDFALVSTAVVITTKNDICKKVRIVLGGVAPTPLRVPLAEEILIGKRVDENIATQAAQMAVSGARPLAKNAYKVTLCQALVKRAILSAV